MSACACHGPAADAASVHPGALKMQDLTLQNLTMADLLFPYPALLARQRSDVQLCRLQYQVVSPCKILKREETAGEWSN